MGILDRFKKPKFESLPPQDERRIVPEGMWVKCEKCERLIYQQEYVKNLKVCPGCNFHFRLSVRERIEQVLDKATFTEYEAHLRPRDPLGFKDSKPYRQRLRDQQKKTGLTEACVIGEGIIGGHQALLAFLDFEFLGGSMGSVVGEKLVRIADRARTRKIPLIIFSASGGARMQEGTLSLMQMAKVSIALSRLHQAKVLFISVLTDPTSGGVAASFSMQGDIIIAEPQCFIGFAGPRVIEQALKSKLPEGFQRAEFLLQKGMLDLIVERKQLKQTLTKLLSFSYGRDE